MSEKNELAFLLPKALILDNTLSYTARRLGAVLYSYGNEELPLTLSPLSRITGSSITTVRANLQELETAGYIQRGRRYHSAHVHLLLPPTPEACSLIPYAILSYPFHASSFCVFLYLRYCGWYPGAEGQPSGRTIQKAMFISEAGLYRSLKEIRAILEEK